MRKKEIFMLKLYAPLHSVKYSEIELHSGSANRTFDMMLNTECVRLPNQSHTDGAVGIRLSAGTEFSFGLVGSEQGYS